MQLMDLIHTLQRGQPLVDDWLLTDLRLDYVAGVRGVVIDLENPPGDVLRLHLVARLAGMEEPHQTRYFCLRAVGTDPGDPAILAVLAALGDLVLQTEAGPGFDPVALWRRPMSVQRHADVLITGRCNQRCIFCSIAADAPRMEPDGEAIREHISRAYDRGGRYFMFAGRECTLLPELPHYVRLARDVGFEDIRLVTNGTLLADPARVEELAAAGLTQFLVSLHGPTAEVADGITGVEGDFERTCQAMDHIIARALVLKISFVACQQNLDQVRAFFAFVPRRFAEGVAQIALSVVAPLHLADERALELIPRYSEAAPVLRDALDFGLAQGLDIVIPDLCGMPPCFLPTHLTRFEELRSMGQSGTTDQKTKIAACERCAAVGACTGIWRRYLELHGEAELDGLPLAHDQLWPTT